MKRKLRNKKLYIVVDKKIGRWRVIGVLLDPSEINRLLPKGEEDSEKVVKLLCGENYDRYECMEEIGEYIGSPLDYAVAGYLRRILGWDFSPTEEGEYGVPEFSVYGNYDVRSYMGRWGYQYKNEWSRSLDDFETGLFWMSIPPDSPAFNKIADLVNEILDEYPNVAIVIVEE